jgi:hypothetical protein
LGLPRRLYAKAFFGMTLPDNRGES